MLEWVEPILRTWLHLIIGMCFLLVMGLIIQQAIRSWIDHLVMRNEDIEQERIEKAMKDVQETLNKYRDMK